MSIPSVGGWLNAASDVPNVNLDALETTLLLQRTADGLLASLERYFERYGLSDGKFGVLMMFVANPDISPNPTPSDLANWCGVTRATITSLLDGLQRCGLVTREPHPDDRRMLVVRLTDSGKELMDQVMPDYFRRTSALMSGLSANEQKQLVALLTKIYSNLPLLTDA